MYTSEDYSGLLMSFMKAFGPSGYEGPVASIFRSVMEETADSVETDRIGNVIAKFDGTDPASPVVMAFAHMDSIGFVARKIENDGYIGLDRLGGVPEKVLPGLNFNVRTVGGGLINGVIGNKSHHTATEEEKRRVNAISELYLDIGASSAAQARKLGVEVGCPAAYQPFAQPLAGGFVSGTSADNRGGLTALTAAGKILKNNRPMSTVYIVGTVWEEFNLRGAVIAARRIKPGITICLDAALSGDTHDLKDRYETACGNGPVLMHYTFHGRGTLNGTLPHMGLAKLVTKAAEDEHIPLQHFAGIGILTDSAYVQLEGDGTAALELGFPVRYTHSPAEVVNTADIAGLGALLAASVTRIDRGFDLYRYR